MTCPPQALQGLRVLELGQLIAGPLAGKTLADFGADGITIEPADGGNPLRHSGRQRWAGAARWRVAPASTASTASTASDDPSQMTSITRQSLTLVKVGPGTTRSPSAAKKL